MKRLWEPKEKQPSKKLKKHSHADDALSSRRELDEPSTQSEPPPFDGAFQLLNATDMCHNPTFDYTNCYLRLKVHMKWNIAGGKLRIQAESIEANQPVRFEIHFTGDRLCLALKGASVVPEKSSRFTDSSTKLPISLLYSEGALLQFMSKKSPLKTGMLIDSWAPADDGKSDTQGPVAADIAPPDPDDWFSTPPTAKVSIEAVPMDVDLAPQAPADVPGPQEVVATSVAPQDTHISPIESEASTLPKTAMETRDKIVPAPPEAVPQPAKQNHTSNTAERRTSRPPLIASGSKSVASAKPLYRDTSKTGRGRQKLIPPPVVEKSLQRMESTSSSDVQNGPQEDIRQNARIYPSKKAQKAANRKAKHNKQPAPDPVPPAVLATEIDSPSDSTKKPSPVPMGTPHKPLTATSPKPEAEASLVHIVRTTSEPTPEQRPEVPPALPARRLGSAPAGTPKHITPGSNAAALSGEEFLPAKQGPSGTVPEGSHDPALDLRAGCFPEDSVVQYPALNDLLLRRLNLIAVVLSVDRRTTVTHESMLKLIVTDPSIYDKDLPTFGFSINCFTKEEPNNIPGVRRGDILILRYVEIQDFHGKKSGVCASYVSWTWALFSPESGATNATANGSKMSFTPSQTELSYCIALGDWWRAVQEQQEAYLRENNVMVHQISGGVTSSVGLKRSHRLIRDAAPSAPPNGYFDCTIEVLNTYENSNGVWSVYVTDYSLNAELPSVDTSWSLPSLVNRILKIEMWDDAAPVAATMQSGQYYDIKNVQMKISAGGYWEAKVNDGRKIRKLDDDELESEPHLAELLTRKKEWEDTAAEGGGEDRFPHMLIHDAELEQHFDCTAYVLHVSLKENDRAFIYVTDYTARNDLARIPATAQWTGDVADDCILKIALTDMPADTAKTLTAGDFIAIRSLRLKAFSGRDKDVSGRLGGGEQLLFKLDPAESGNGNLIALLRRKKDWEKKINSRHYSAASGRGLIQPPTLKTNGKTRKLWQELGMFTIKELEAYDVSSGPAIFHVVARIVDFRPLHLVDCVVLRCTECNEDIPANFKICTKCDDSMDTHVRPIYRFFFEIEDEEGDRLIVSAVNPKLDFLKDLPPADLQEDEEALGAFTERLRPLLGNLITEHEKLVDNAEDGRIYPDWEVPFFKMRIAGVPVEDSKVGYFFLEIDQTPLV